MKRKNNHFEDVSVSPIKNGDFFQPAMLVFSETMQ